MNNLQREYMDTQEVAKIQVRMGEIEKLIDETKRRLPAHSITPL